MWCYEAGTEEIRTSVDNLLTKPLIQKIKIHIYITRDQAKIQAESLYENNNKIKANSELMSSCAWETALNFICQNSKYGYILSITLDRTYANLSPGVLELTGNYKNYKYRYNN